MPWAEVVLLEDHQLEDQIAFRDDPAFQPGKQLEIMLRVGGNEGKDQTVFAGIITGNQLRTRRTGLEMTIQVHDPIFQATLERRNAYFEEMDDAKILQDVLGSYPGCELAKIDGGGVNHPEMIQYNSTDWDFALARMRANGQLLAVTDGKLEILAPESLAAEVRLTLGKDEILDMELAVDLRWAADKVQVKSWNGADKELQDTEEASRPRLSPGKWGKETRPGAFPGQPLEMLFPAPIESEEATAYGKGRQVQDALSILRGTVTVRGGKEYRLGQVIELVKVGGNFDGPALLTGISHEANPLGWLTHLQFGMAHTPFPSPEKINAPPASGLLPAIGGLHLGIVDQYTEDEVGAHRIKVMLPGLAGKAKYQWARWLAPDAGDGRGVMFRPEKGDEVVVGFLNDDPRHPIVLGALHSSSAPPPQEPDEANTYKGIFTRSKLKIQFDDEKKTILVETPGGQQVCLDDETPQLLLKNEKNEVVMDGDGVAISTKGKITLDAKGDIELKTTGNLSFEASQVKTK